MAIFVIGCSPENQDARDDTSQDADSLFLIIDYGNNDADTNGLMYSIVDTSTVLVILTELAMADSLHLEIEEQAFGTLVQQIGDRRNGEGGYWLYTINSEPVPEAASTCIPSPGDTIRFFFSTQ